MSLEEVEWDDALWLSQYGDDYEDALETEWKDKCTTTRHRRARRERREVAARRKAVLSEA